MEPKAVSQDTRGASIYFSKPYYPSAIGSKGFFFES